MPALRSFRLWYFQRRAERKMVNITIDNQKISVPSGTTIMEAAAKLGTPIPKLCYLKDINEIAACRVCVVEIEGKDRLVTSCNNVVTEGMVIYTNSPKVRIARRQTVQLILSQHDCKCATCATTTFFLSAIALHTSSVSSRSRSAPTGQ